MPSPRPRHIPRSTASCRRSHRPLSWRRDRPSNANSPARVAATRAQGTMRSSPLHHTPVVKPQDATRRRNAHPATFTRPPVYPPGPAHAASARRRTSAESVALAASAPAPLLPTLARPDGLEDWSPQRKPITLGYVKNGVQRFLGAGDHVRIHEHAIHQPERVAIALQAPKMPRASLRCRAALYEKPNIRILSPALHKNSSGWSGAVSTDAASRYRQRQETEFLCKATLTKDCTLATNLSRAVSSPHPLPHHESGTTPHPERRYQTGRKYLPSNLHTSHPSPRRGGAGGEVRPPLDPSRLTPYALRPSPTPAPRSCRAAPAYTRSRARGPDAASYCHRSCAAHGHPAGTPRSRDASTAASSPPH